MVISTLMERVSVINDMRVHFALITCQKSDSIYTAVQNIIDKFSFGLGDKLKPITKQNRHTTVT